MSAPKPAARLVEPRAAIQYHAANTEDCLRLALFAEAEPTLGQGIADSLRNLAATYSDTAFRWSRQLTHEVNA